MTTNAATTTMMMLQAENAKEEGPFTFASDPLNPHSLTHSLTRCLGSHDRAEPFDEAVRKGNKTPCQASRRPVIISRFHISPLSLQQPRSARLSVRPSDGLTVCPFHRPADRRPPSPGGAFPYRPIDDDCHISLVRGAAGVIKTLVDRLFVLHFKVNKIITCAQENRFFLEKGLLAESTWKYT